MSENEDNCVLLGSIACLLQIKKIYLPIIKKRKPKRYGIHPIFQLRKSQGFYKNLIDEMRLHDPYMFYNFTRMSPASFDKLLSLVGPHIQKKSLREPISPGCR